MKISRFKISNGFQFDDFEVDLTYPKGHDKEGQPLDKVCFIGQSGTGKSTILEELLLASQVNRNISFPRSTAQSQNFELDLFFGKVKMYSKFDIKSSKNQITFFDENLASISPSSALTEIKIESPELFHQYYFPASDLNLTSKKIIKYDKLQIFEENNSKRLWSSLANKIKHHTNERSKYIFAIAGTSDKNKRDFKFKELDNWDKKNPSPLGELADNFLNPILKHFKLRVKTNLENLQESNFINLIDPYGKKTNERFWSTGTKQIVHKTIPIYINSPKDSIIVIDEPENSLYPDIQTKIVDHYTRLGKDNQFFFATHSPLIASSFEPWEVVELKFDKNGRVKREEYYAEENHVDNYFLDPRYLKWDSILTRIFDLEVDSNIEFRSKKLLEFSVLKNKLQKLKDKGELKNPTPETKKLIEDYKKIGKLLDWKAGL